MKFLRRFLDRATAQSIRACAARAGAIVPGGILLLGLIVAAALMANARLSATSAVGPLTLGVDANTSGNGANQLGSIESCLEVGIGSEFPIDIYITDVTGLRAWELNFAFDPSLLEITSRDLNFFLGPPAFNASEPLPDLNGQHFLSIGAAQGVTKSGSGVLARLTLRAKANGVSPVGLVSDPDYKGPFLNPGPDAIGNTDGDILGSYDGPISSANVAIGQSCSSVPTPSPTPVPTPTPAPTPTPTPGGSPTQTPGGSPTSTPGGSPTATPGGSPTPTPHGSPTPTPDGSPAPTHTPGPTQTPDGHAAGDTDCNGAVNAVDALGVLRHVAGLPALSPAEPCPDLGSTAGDVVFGDVNCSDDVDAIDSLLILRHIAALPVQLPPGCPQIGT